MRPIHEQLREYRRRRGITVTFIAERVGISPGRLSALERGEIRLSADELEKICRLGYEISPAHFYGKEEA